MFGVIVKVAMTAAAAAVGYNIGSSIFRDVRRRYEEKKKEKAVRDAKRKLNEACDG